MQAIVIKAENRQTGKQPSKQVRRNGFVPGVYYCQNVPSINIQVSAKSLRPIVYTSKLNMVHLDVDGEIKHCILKEVKFHPVTDEIIHFDLLGLSENKKVSTEIPVELVGQPIGVRKGGTFQQVFHKCRIKCLPKNLVSSLKVDISNLDVGKSIYLRDLELEGIEFGIPLDSLVCAVNIPRGKAGEALREAAK